LSPIGEFAKVCYPNSMKKLKTSSLVLFFTLMSVLFTLACSQMQRRSTPGAEVRDVPFSARGDEDQNLRERVLILPFLAEGPGASSMTEEARGFFVKEMGRTGQFVIINPEDLTEDPKKHITEENQYNMDPVAKLASGMGLTAVIEGKVLDVHARRLGD